MPGGYSLPEYLEPITLKPVFRPEPLLQAARKVIGEVALVVPGDNVLILSDSSINPLLPQVFEQAALEKKAEVRTHSIPLSPTSDTVTLLQEQHWRDWWPQETWDEVRTADVVLALAYINPEFLKEPLLSGQIESGQLRFISVTAVPELLAAPGALYPPEIIDLLAEKIALQLGQAKTIRVTDPAGTALTFTPGNVTHSPPAPSLAFPYNAWVQVTPGEDVRGSVVSHAISTGFMPLLRMGIEAGRMVSLQGGGENWRAAEITRSGVFPTTHGRLGPASQIGASSQALDRFRRAPQSVVQRRESGCDAYGFLGRGSFTVFLSSGLLSFGLGRRRRGFPGGLPYGPQRPGGAPTGGSAGRNGAPGGPVHSFTGNFSGIQSPHH